MCYKYFTIETRVVLYNLLKIKLPKNLSYREIANLLEISHSTIIREVNNNGGVQNYDPYLANTKSAANKSKRGRKSKLTPKIKKLIEDALSNICGLKVNKETRIHPSIKMSPDLRNMIK